MIICSKDDLDAMNETTAKELEEYAAHVRSTPSPPGMMLGFEPGNKYSICWGHLMVTVDMYGLAKTRLVKGEVKGIE